MSQLEEGDSFLSQTVTGDKNMGLYIMPKSKQHRHTYLPVKVKAKQTLPQDKNMVLVFWDRNGVLMVSFMQQGTTINSEAYCKMLRMLCKIIQKKHAIC